MILGIDASNIRVGGGLSHLVELLSAADPIRDGFEQVVVWAAADTLRQLPSRPWLLPAHEPALAGSLLRRLFWQWWHLPRRVRDTRCDVLFILRGAYRACACPVVTISHNLLPFEWRELARYGVNRMTLRLLLLRLSQARAFRRADGMIFLTRYARAAVERVTGPLAGRVAVIPHAAASRFVRRIRERNESAKNEELAVLYVSTIAPYKHPWHVVDAVARLRARGFSVTLTLVGSAHGPSLKRLDAVRKRVDPAGQFVRYAGSVPYEAVDGLYEAADAVVFASSCENMPIALLEGMGAGLPIASSNRGPMPEVLRDSAVYFDPENVDEIEAALLTILRDHELRRTLGARAQQVVSEFSWERCAKETFELLSEVARRGAPIEPTQGRS